MSNAVIRRGVTVNVQAGATITGIGSQPVFLNYISSTTGSITAGSSTLTLSAAHTIQAGDVVSVRGAAGTFDGVAMPLHARVLTVVGSVLTLDRPAVATATTAEVRTGEADITITGAGTIDGDGGAQTICKFGHCSRVTVDSLNIINTNGSPAGAVMLALGTMDSTVADLTLSGHGDPDGSPQGVGVWLFGGVEDCAVDSVQVTGGMYGVVIDDQSSPTNEWEGNCTGNLVTRSTFTGGRLGVGIEGSSDNAVTDCTFTGCHVGVQTHNSGQGTTESRTADDNTITGNTFTTCTTGVLLEGVATVQSGNTFTGCTFDVTSYE